MNTRPQATHRARNERIPGAAVDFREWAALNREILHNPDTSEVLARILGRGAEWLGAEAAAVLLPNHHDRRSARPRALKCSTLEAIRTQ